MEASTISYHLAVEGYYITIHRERMKTRKKESRKPVD